MRNALLEKLARSTPLSLGHAFSSQYKYPLSAFLSKDENNPEVIQIAAGGFTQTSVRELLSEILAGDSFLRQCCGKPEALAKAIDVLFLDQLQVEAFPTNEPTLAFLPHLFEEALSEFDQVLYNNGDFKKYAYFHLYNLEIVGDLKLQPPYAGWFITKLEPSSVPVLFGESSASSFISPMTTGTHFLVCQDTDGFEQENLYEWLSRRWQDAHPYRQVLQYGIEGIVNIDYVCPYFSPDWINKVHKWGLYYLGQPIRESLPFPFKPFLSECDQEQINRMWRTYAHYGKEINATGSALRKAIRIAGNFFEDYHRKTSRVEQFASLMIALEALFTPSDQAEQSYRISQSCALLSSEDYDGNGRQEVFEFLRKMFKRRGKLFHGQFDVAESKPDELASDEEIHILANLVRKSILRFMAIYLSGEDDLEGLRKQLQKATFDENIRDKLLKKGDFESFIDDSQPQLFVKEDLARMEERTDSTEVPPATPES